MCLVFYCLKLVHLEMYVYSFASRNMYDAHIMDLAPLSFQTTQGVDSGNSVMWLP